MSDASTAKRRQRNQVNPLYPSPTLQESVDPAIAEALETTPVSADEWSVFQYALKLRYPNGRIFDYLRESEHLLGVGNEFDAFGRTWRVACDALPSRFSSEYPSHVEAFLCHPVDESEPVRTTTQR